MKSKEEILRSIVNDLNREDQKWKITVDGDKIIADWKWMDATLFSPSEITNEVKEFKFVVTLLDNGKWKETDISSSTTSSPGLGGCSFNKSGFKGKQFGKSITFGVGKNNDTDEVGLQTFKFNTDDIKKPIREYLKNSGWKKKGLF